MAGALDSIGELTLQLQQANVELIRLGQTNVAAGVELANTLTSIINALNLLAQRVRKLEG